MGIAPALSARNVLGGLDRSARLGPPQLYAVTFAVGTLDVLFFVAYSTLFVSVVSPDRYIDGQALLNSSRAISSVLGQSGAGLLIAAITAPGAIIVDAVSFLISAFALARIHPTEPPTEPASRGHLIAGARFIRHARTVRAALGATATVNFFTFAFNAIVILYATRSLHIRPAVLGLVLGCGAVGGLVGSLITGRLTRRIGVGPTFVAGCILFPAPLALVPLASGPHIVVLACLFAAEFGAGAGVMLLDISIGAIFAGVVPDRLRSRSLRCLPHRQLRHPATRRNNRRSARQRHGPTADAVARRARRRRLCVVAGALPDAPVARSRRR
jgi:Na+/melibiose symporter-like transporter